jgi:hypothetical protein
MKRPRNTSSTPNGNWNVTLPVINVRIESNHYRAWMGLIGKALEANDMNERGWEEGIVHLACEQNPQWDCEDTEIVERGTTVEDVWRAFKTATKWVSGGGKLVDQEEADRRASICVSCPKHGNVTGCVGCRGVLNWSFDLLGNRRTQQDANLAQCKVCGCELKVKVWMPLDAISGDAIDGDYPNACWCKSVKP